MKNPGSNWQEGTGADQARSVRLVCLYQPACAGREMKHGAIGPVK